MSPSDDLAWHGAPWHDALVEAGALGMRDPRPVRVRPDEVDSVLQQAHLDRIETALVAAIDLEIVQWPEADRERLDQQLIGALVSTVAVESHLVQLHDLLAGTPIRWRVLKGAAVAHLDFRDPALRLFGDVDVLVHSADWDELIVRLRAHGYVRPTPERRPDFDRRFGKGATFVRADGLELDLHLRFAVGRFGVLCHPDDLFAVRAETFTVAGRQMPALPLAYRWLHACFHEAIGGFRGLRAARDVAHLLLTRHADWTAATRISTAWGVDAVLATAIRDSWKLLGLEGADHPAATWAEDYAFSVTERSALRAMRESSSYRRHALSAVTAIRNPVDRVRYLASLVMPAAGGPAGVSRRSNQRRPTGPSKPADA